MNGPILLPVLPTDPLSKQALICSQECQARCCKYIIVKIPAPCTRADHEEIRWWVAHEGISVHIAQRKWYLQVFTKCHYLAPNNLCNAYEKRPDACREYDPSNCEFTAELAIEREFTSMDEYDQYLEEKRLQRRRVRQKPRPKRTRKRSRAQRK